MWTSVELVPSIYSLWFPLVPVCSCDIGAAVSRGVRAFLLRARVLRRVPRSAMLPLSEAGGEDGHRDR